MKALTVSVIISACLLLSTSDAFAAKIKKPQVSAVQPPAEIQEEPTQPQETTEIDENGETDEQTGFYPDFEPSGDGSNPYSSVNDDDSDDLIGPGNSTEDPSMTPVPIPAPVDPTPEDPSGN